MFDKLFTHFTGLKQAILPRKLFQRELLNIFDELLLLKDEEKEKIKNRLNYYNKLKKSFSFNFSELGPNGEIVEKIGKISFKKSFYAYDAYEISRYFKDDFLWIKSFGDINHALPSPSITKSRPILKADNNILLKLDKKRHFIFLKDALAYKDKENKLFYRGAIMQKHRKSFFKQYYQNELCDLAHVGKDLLELRKWRKKAASKKTHMKYKFILSLEGNDVASNLKWAMSTNSLVISPKLHFETWFMEGKLKDELAFIKEDELIKTLEYFIIHEKEALEKIKLAHEYIKQFQDEKIELYLGILSLAKYFYLSKQLELKEEILEFFS